MYQGSFWLEVRPARLGSGPDRAESSQGLGESGQIVDGGEVGAFRIRIGDCFQDPDLSSEEFESVDAVPCSGPHDNEAYAAFNLPGDDYPGEESVVEQASIGCYERFEGFVGTAYADSSLDFFPMYPTEGSWEELDDREILCAVYNSDFSPATGSAKNSAR